jgi:trehalose 6-phosphate synthase
VNLIVCSNSAPRWDQGTGLLPRSPGGLVPLLVTLLRDGGDWVCTAPASGPPAAPDPVAHGPVGPGLDATVSVAVLPDGVRLHQIRLPAPVLKQHYLDIGIRLMLWLFHYLLDTSREPSFDDQFAAAWASYEEVNQAYAHHLAAMPPGGHDDVILINDYHLFLVPELLAKAGGRPGRLVYFHGLPWCEPDYFRVLPARLREAILRSLLYCDIVGFHSRRWAHAFAECCARFLPGCTARSDCVEWDGHRTRLAVRPFPLDVDVVDRMSGESATAGWHERLARLAAGRRVIARADRIDLWKNLPRGFSAYERLLARKQALARDWWFVAVATMPSTTTERTRALHAECEAIVSALNDRFGVPGRPAVSLIYPDLVTSRNCVLAALAQADVTFANPTFDGMNLVAKEALYAAPRAPLLLSENAGAYEQLAPLVTPLQPFDVVGTSMALGRAMEGEIPPQGPEARILLRGQDAAGWLAGLTGLEEAGARPEPKGYLPDTQRMCQARTRHCPGWAARHIVTSLGRTP